MGLAEVEGFGGVGMVDETVEMRGKVKTRALKRRVRHP